MIKVAQSCRNKRKQQQYRTAATTVRKVIMWKFLSISVTVRVEFKTFTCSGKGEGTLFCSVFVRERETRMDQQLLVWVCNVMFPKRLN